MKVAAVPGTTFRETLAERDRVRCREHGWRVTGDAIEQALEKPPRRQAP